MPWKHLMGAALAVMTFGCGDSTPGGGGGAGGESCWYCDGSGGSTSSSASSGASASSGKGGGGGKSGTYLITMSGTLDTATGEGTYRYEEADDSGPLCDVSYVVSGATEDTSCSACSFAFTMPLSAPSASVDTACSGKEPLTGTAWGHMDPDVLMYTKDGAWYETIGDATSVVDATSWTYSWTIDLGGSK